MSCPNPYCHAHLPASAKACPACRLPLPGVLHLGRFAISGIVFRGEHVFHYQAIDQETDRSVEVRVLINPDPKARGLFLTEARTLMGLSVPDLQGVHSVHEEGLASAVLEGVGDRASRDFLPYGEKDLLRLAWQAAKLLTAMHGRGVVHRDIRPEHLRLDLKRQLTLVGWGWERLIGIKLGQGWARDPAGQDYMAPELLKGEAVPKSDLYGLGMTLVHLATGLEPGQLYEPESQSYQWRAHARLSDPFAEAIDALIQPQLNRRLGTAKTLERRLSDLLPPELQALASDEPSAPASMPAWLTGARQTLEGLDPDPRLGLAALLLLLFPMLPAWGPGVRQPMKWTFTTVGDRPRVPSAPPISKGLRVPVEPTPEVRLARDFARALLHRPATVSLVPLRPVDPVQALAPTTWTPPDPAEPVAWEIRVSRAHHLLEVYRDSLRIMAFPVGLGANGSTPVGSFEIVNKAAEPAYRRPDGSIVPGAAPQNPLGTRWLGLQVPGRTGIGIHGTPYLDSIGDDLSLGCIRMRNPDVEKLYQAIPAHVWVSIEP